MGGIIISDDLPELLQNCDRILVMRRGAIVAERDARRVTEDDLYTIMSSGPDAPAQEALS